MLNVDVAADRRDFTVRAALDVADGERVALFGPSGAGKTTVLEVIAGLVEPQSGRVELGGRTLTSTAPPRVAVPPWERRVGLLRQDPGLFPHLSVRANLTYARSSRAGHSAAGVELTEIAASLGIEELLAAMPARLSGGQRHRVALGRLLLARCDALLLDEPFASLDAALRRSLTALVKELSSQRSVPSVLVTHQLSDAQAFADRLLVMDAGAILQAGAPDAVVLRPASRRVAELVGYLGFVPAGDGVVAGVHPDRVLPGAEPERGLVVTGAVTAARPSGAGWEADLLVGDAPFTCRLPSRLDGAQVSVTLLDPPYFGLDGASVATANILRNPQ
ncbi:MAG TPA: ABC transporter ATP-binding protein [Trebonia sp.]|nr:ABC transporter ATP-binding protein [Trebonia sp.]